MARRRVRVRVSGRVQGVFYRQSMRVEAERRGASGWVRNLPDGSVEAEVEGEPAAVAAVLRWCGRGPAGSRVDSVDARGARSEGGGAFEVLY